MKKIFLFSALLAAHGSFTASAQEQQLTFYVSGGSSLPLGGLAFGKLADLIVDTPDEEVRLEGESGSDAMVIAGAGLQHRLNDRSTLTLEVRYGRVSLCENPGKCHPERSRRVLNSMNRLRLRSA